MSLALSLLAGPVIPARGQAPVSPAPAMSDSTGVQPSAPAACWYRTRSFRTVAAPALLIGYGVSAVGERGFPVSSKDMYRARQTYFPGFRTGIDDFTLLVPAMAVYGLGAAGVGGKHSPGQQTVLLLLSGALANGISLGLKGTSGTLRPDGTTPNSFPSGHTTNAFVAAEFLHQEYKHRSGWYSVAGYSVAGATGVLRMLNNRHWLSDVLAGAGIGMLSVKVVYLAYPWAYRKLTGRAPDKVGLVPTYGAGGAGFYAVIRLD
ncbi:MAG: phosphatase PAP2 family protein [Cytophagales bacterium]|nr:phosphatase PAP2 family protein [Cytophagales bacterium]